MLQLRLGRDFCAVVAGPMQDTAYGMLQLHQRTFSRFPICTESFLPESLLSHLIHLNKSVHGDHFNTDVSVTRLSLPFSFFPEIKELWHFSYLLPQGLEFLKAELCQQHGPQMGGGSALQTFREHCPLNVRTPVSQK